MSLESAPQFPDELRQRTRGEPFSPRQIRSSLRTRLGLLTWQEIAATLPARLQQFLDEKYGIAEDSRRQKTGVSIFEG